MYFYYSIKVKNYDSNIFIYFDELFLNEFLKGCLKNDKVKEWFINNKIYCPKFDFNILNIYLINNDDLLCLIIECNLSDKDFISKLLSDNLFLTIIDRDFKIRNLLLDDKLYDLQWGKIVNNLEKPHFYDLNMEYIHSSETNKNGIQDKLKTKLYDYQIDNINWMINNEINGIKNIITNDRLLFLENEMFNITTNMSKSKSIYLFENNNYIYGGLIMDDPGIGKTLQMLSLILSNHLELNTIVIVPDHLYDYWYEQINIHINNNNNNNNNNYSLNIIRFKDIVNEDIDKYQRIIIDEIHEIYNLDIFNKIINSNAKYRWAVSATPNVSINSLTYLLSFLSGKKLYYGCCHRYNIYDNLWNKIIKRNTIKNTININKLPELVINNIFIEFTEEENLIYQAEKITGDTEILRKICCDIIIGFTNSNLDNFNNISFDNFKIFILNKYLEEYNYEQSKLDIINNNIDNLKNTQDNLKNTQDNLKNTQDILKYYENLKRVQEDKVNKYKNKYEYFKDKIENKQNCPICMDIVSDIKIITECGHLFCYECSKIWFDKNIKCPYCRTDIDKSNNYIINKNTNEIKSSKINKLIDIIKNIPKNEQVIIYSQFDIIREKLANIINNNNVLLLSSNINTSGLDYSHINNLIIFEPFNSKKEIEKQLIGRIYRINQKNTVNIYRLIIKNSIEEELYL